MIVAIEAPTEALAEIGEIEDPKLSELERKVKKDIIEQMLIRRHVRAGMARAAFLAALNERNLRCGVPTVFTTVRFEQKRRASANSWNPFNSKEKIGCGGWI